MPSAIEISGLTKAYRTGHVIRSKRIALSDLTLTVGGGEVFGYLGPNGSGKTTTLKLLLGLLFPDAGTARILGLPLADPAWRYRIGYLPENPYLYDYLTALEYLDYVGRLFALSPSTRRERARQLLDRVGMLEASNIPLRRVSKGMLQRVGLAQALMNDPELVILDEPMSGLDPVGRHLVKEIIRSLKAQGRTVFFSTHVLGDAEALCDRVALLRSGRLVAVGRIDEILNLDFTHLEVIVSGVSGSLLADLAAVGTSDAMGERFSVDVNATSLTPIVQRVEAAGGRVLSVQPIRQSLEDFFMEKMAKQPEVKGS